MNAGDRVLVIGGGVIGLTAAYYLRQAGLAVTVIERDTLAGGCSRSNCGYICPSHVLPLTEPGAVALALKSLFRPDAPFRVAPRLDPALWGWLLRFAARCRHGTMLEAGRALQALLDASAREYRDLLAAEALDCDWREDGLLYVLETPAGLDAFARMDDLVAREFGLRARRMDAAALHAFDPAFRPDLAGAFLYPGDAALDPERFCRALADRLRERGVELIEGCGLRGLRRSGGRVAAAETDRGEMTADGYLLATGARAGDWQRALGCRLPVQPGKGYSITLDPPAPCPGRATLFPEHRVGITPLAGAVRLGSMMEFSGFDTRIPPARLQQLRDSANRYVVAPFDGPARDSWYGWRPMTYDSLPIIGRAPGLHNLVLAVGHNMLGMTLAPATGRLVADLFTGTAPRVDPAPYRPDRFRPRGRPARANSAR